MPLPQHISTTPVTRKTKPKHSKISYLGPRGTFSEEAARVYGGRHAIYIAAHTSEAAVTMIESSLADYAIIPAENSNEGSVDRSLDILLATSTTICGEVYLPIHHQLLSTAKNVQSIREILAHPQALGQCKIWLSKHAPRAKLIPVISNGEAAKIAADDPDKAAIASTRAATIYALPIVAKNIEDSHNNTTRFLVLGINDTPVSTSDNKTTLVFSVPHQPGSLYKVLGALARRNINLTRIESRPSTHTPWEYNFFIDIVGHRTDASIMAALAEMESLTLFLKVAGSYRASSGAISAT